MGIIDIKRVITGEVVEVEGQGNVMAAGLHSELPINKSQRRRYKQYNMRTTTACIGTGLVNLIVRFFYQD